MKFTGERFIPTEQGRIRLEHYHRYAAVKDIVAQKQVLDLACGEGYGSAFMADFAEMVAGVDISQEAINHASQTYQKSNLIFQQGSATALDLPDKKFDIVVSFETIEHLSEQDEMLKEIRRVLRPKGILIISSPNRPVYSEESGEHNEFHVKELDFDDFDELLKRQFPFVQYYGQRLMMGSVIQSLEGGQTSYQAWNDDGKNLNPQSGNFSEPVYFLAIAGADEANLPKVLPSVIYPKDLDLVKHYVGFAKWAKDLDREINEKNNYIVNLNKEIHERNQHITKFNLEIQNRDQHISDFTKTIFERDQQISNRDQQIFNRDQQISNLNEVLAKQNNDVSNLNQILLERNSELSNLNQHLTEKNQEIIELEQHLTQQNQQIVELNQRIVSLNDEVFRRGEWGLSLDAELAEERKISYELRNLISDIASSESWRITLPLRESKLWLKQPKQQTKRYAKKSLQLAKSLYQSRFEGEQTRDNHRRILAKYAPRLLSFTDTRFDGREKSPISPEEIARSTSNIPQQLRENLFTDGTVSPLEKAKSIRIPSSENPLVSVIIPIYGKVSYTLNCLGSIAENVPQVPFEVIVIDDCSPDESFKILQSVEGIRLIQNEQNKGFIRSCNRGADLAKGEYLYFLNNDTQVTPGWMDELIRTFHEFPGTGLVGSKLIYPDGKLQEAGGIIWQDGSAWNFGRFQDPQLPIYNYAREVDYCSGASIVVPKALFDELGGFDEHYLPAYCEDSDLALKIRDKDYRVVYQPLSTIIHFEGISSGTDMNSGAKAFQVENERKLFKHWETRLKNHQTAGTDVDKAKDRIAKRRVLVLEHCTPTPNQDAGSVTTYNLMLLLREMGFQVTFIPEDNFLYMPEYTTALQRNGIEVLYAPYLTSVEQHLKDYGSRYDLAFLFRPLVVERNIEAICHYCPQAKILYYSHDLHFLRMSREAELYQDVNKQKLAEEMKSRELEVLKSVDAAILVSPQELAQVQDYFFEKEKLHTLPLILNIPGTIRNFEEREGIVFVGGYQHTPNIDAVKYFVNEIMPFVREMLPGVTFYAVGSNPPAEILALAADDVIVKGFIDDLDSFFDQRRVSVAPLRYGAGIKGKVGTAMAAGLPVVATPLAIEGMCLTDKRNILVADTPKGLAEAIAKLYKNEKLWDEISLNGLNFARKEWGMETAWLGLAKVLYYLAFDVIKSGRILNFFGKTQLSRDLKLINKSYIPK
jgi:O-antigen biosynthesis protein